MSWEAIQVVGERASIHSESGFHPSRMEHGYNGTLFGWEVMGRGWVRRLCPWEGDQTILEGYLYKPLHIGTQPYFSVLRILEILQVGLVLTRDTAVVLCGGQAQNFSAEKSVEQAAKPGGHGFHAVLGNHWGHLYNYEFMLHRWKS